MISHPHLDIDDDFGGDFAGNNTTSRSDNKRNFADLETDEDDMFGSKKSRLEVEETAPGVATGMILSLRESLQNCKDSLASSQNDLEDARSEIQKWHLVFQNESFIPEGSIPEPRVIVDYIQSLKLSEKSLKVQLETAKRKEASCIVQYAKREQEMAELKAAVRDLRVQLKPPSMQARRLLLDPAIHEEFTRLKSLVEEKDKKLKELQDNIAAVSFTPQSKMGKMLMAKCKTLQEENEEIGHQAAEGKMHELSMKLASQKAQNTQLRGQFEGLFKHMDALTDDVERSNETTVILQEKLEAKELELEKLKREMQEKGFVEEEKHDLADDKTDLDDDIKNSGDVLMVSNEDEDQN